MLPPNLFELPKDQWGEGEWNNEPEEFEFDYKGYHCIALRNFVGSWCGYVEVPLELVSKINEDYLDSHGGITYSSQVPPNYFNNEKSENFHYYGFDCSHARDYSPALEARMNILEQCSERMKAIRDDQREFRKKFKHFELHSPTYKTLIYVRGTLMEMVDQIIDISEGKDVAKD